MIALALAQDLSPGRATVVRWAFEHTPVPLVLMPLARTAADREIATSRTVASLHNRLRDAVARSGWGSEVLRRGANDRWVGHRIRRAA